MHLPLVNGEDISILSAYPSYNVAYLIVYLPADLRHVDVDQVRTVVLDKVKNAREMGGFESAKSLAGRKA